MGIKGENMGLLKTHKILLLVLLLLLATSMSAAKTYTKTVSDDNQSGLYANNSMKSPKPTVTEYDKLRIVELLKPEDLGIAEPRIDNLNIIPIGSKVSTRHTNNQSTLKDGAPSLNDTGHQIILDGLTRIAKGTASGIEIQRDLMVYEIVPIYANIEKKIYVTKKTIIIRPENKYRDITLIDIMPEDVAKNISYIYHSDSHEIIEEKPLALMWKFQNISTQDSINITYYIKNLIVGTEGTTLLAFGGLVNPVSNNDYQDEDILNPDDIGANIFTQGVKDLSKGSNILKVSLAAILILIVMMIFLELDNKHFLDGLKKLIKDIEASVRVGYANRRIIDSYIKECLENGYHIDDINMSLVRAGWNKLAIRAMISKYR